MKRPNTPGTLNEKHKVAMYVVGSMKRDSPALKSAVQSLSQYQDFSTELTAQSSSQISRLKAECGRLTRSLTSRHLDLAAQTEQLQEDRYTLEHRCSEMENLSGSDCIFNQAFSMSLEEYKAEATQLRLAIENLGYSWNR